MAYNECVGMVSHDINIFEYSLALVMKFLYTNAKPSYTFNNIKGKQYGRECLTALYISKYEHVKYYLIF